MNSTTHHLSSPVEVRRQHDVEAFRHSLGDDLPQFLALVAEICNSPMAALTLIGVHEVTIIAAHGMPAAPRWPRADRLHDTLSVTGHTTVIADGRTAPLTGTGFAAAAPLHLDGTVVGALCVFDPAPHSGDLGPVTRRLTGLAHRLDVESSLRRAAPFALMTELHKQLDKAMITAVGHEVRTPLTVIQGHLEILGDRPEVQDTASQWQISAINRNVHRLCRTIDRLLLTPGRPVHGNLPK
jgi:signal transduction histidine kinase